MRCIVRCVSFGRKTAAASDAVRKQVLKAQQDIKLASEAVPPIYELDWNEIGVPWVDAVQPTEGEPELNWDEPPSLQEVPLLRDFQVVPKRSNVVGKFRRHFQKE